MVQGTPTPTLTPSLEGSRRRTLYSLHLLKDEVSACNEGYTTGRCTVHDDPQWVLYRGPSRTPDRGFPS